MGLKPYSGSCIATNFEMSGTTRVQLPILKLLATCLVGHSREECTRQQGLLRRDKYNGGVPINQAPGHQEPELALCRLYRATGNELYLNMAKKFLIFVVLHIAQMARAPCRLYAQRSASCGADHCRRQHVQPTCMLR